VITVEIKKYLRILIWLPSQCKVRKWWSIDQDEWFNLYLYLGSCWVNKSRYEARYDTRYDTGYKVRNWQRSLDTKSGWNPDVWGLRLHLNQFQDHLLKKDQFVDDLFIIYRINQEPGSVCVRVRWDGPTRIFQTNFSSRIR